MENTKAKKLLIGVLLVLLVVCLGVIVWQYISLNLKDSNVTNNTASENSQEINIIQNETTNKETVVEYVSLVTDRINKYNKKAGKENCGDRDMDLYLKVRIPQINIDATNAKKLNNEIYEKYKEYDNDNYTISSNKGGRDIDISYTYKYEPEKSIILIIIKNKILAHCATGGMYYDSYVYDTKNDKVLTVDDLLNLYDISEESKQDFIDSAIIDVVGTDDDDYTKERISEYKSRIADMENKRKYEIEVIDVCNDSFVLWYPAYLEGLSVEFIS